MIISILIIYSVTIFGGIFLYKKYKFLRDNLDKEYLITTREDLKEVYEQYRLTLETLEEYKRIYTETRRYVINATVKLEQRPEQVRKELLSKLKEKDKEIKLITDRLNNLKQSVDRENKFLFQSVRKLEDTTVRRNNPSIRY